MGCSSSLGGGLGVGARRRGLGLGRRRRREDAVHGARDQSNRFLLDGTEILAPFDGTVVELDHEVGETLLPNQQVALVADLKDLYVETNDLTEMDVVKLSVGQAATVNPDALPDVSLPSSVTEIARSSGKKGGDVTYTVRLKLEKTDPRLRWGMTVAITFLK